MIGGVAIAIIVIMVSKPFLCFNLSDLSQNYSVDLVVHNRGMEIQLLRGIKIAPAILMILGASSAVYDQLTSPTQKWPVFSFGG